MTFDDIMEMYRENTRNVARAHFIPPDVLLAVEDAIVALHDACDDDLGEATYLIDYVIREYFLDYEEPARDDD